ncbi:SpoIIE family protein phosphatase [Actinacidiphila sp. ITFR-21]|uniref:SpoIIE family protein phosphatase n=1 Tax=Actinacidiphila sp. ITFR-21 TaxID=3075199 RepID=UPI0037D9EB6A
MAIVRGSPLLTVRDVSKRFGAVQALREVDLTVDAGEVVGLVGSNGAGKSTLVKAISGAFPPESGIIEWKGRRVEIRRPIDARDLGIATVHQNLSLCDNLDTVDNLFLGRPMRRFGMLDSVRMEKRSRNLLDTLGVRIPSLRVPVASLSGSQRQGVAIARALIGDPELVVMDEPTAALGPEQAALVLELVQRLRDQRVGVLLVSHEMDEVRAVADRVAVLRVGRNSGLFDTKYTTQEQIDSAVTGNHAMAVTLQRSLLPHGLPEQDALDVAYRYLPAQAGVGGDWFDVIPLSGARVALVVGDIVGHGVHAAATMGRLRTAVHNFSMLDLPPDELLAHLDDLVLRIDRDEATAGGVPVAGATCLYAVYDPVSGTCELARAGHLPPGLVRPDGTAEFLDVPAGPPLGLGGLPFEAVEHRLPEGSRLVLYTDGLVEDRNRDIDVGLDLLRAALTGPDRTPEQACVRVLDALLPANPQDDIALLIARTHALPADHIAHWEVPSDPAAVATVRDEASRRLEAWGLAELAFTTELVLSELVTNAIRYATGPIGVRLLRDRTLICEVADTGSTSPHLRYAASTDEGGRGLFLVAQIAEHWGTRHTPAGKIIWAEQRLPAVPAAGI